MFSPCMQTQRLLAALMANGALGNGVNPAMVAAGLNPPMVLGGGAGLIGQPQVAQVSSLDCHFKYLRSAKMEG